jgi:hypothetical protein
MASGLVPNMVIIFFMILFPDIFWESLGSGLINGYFAQFHLDFLHLFSQRTIIRQRRFSAMFEGRLAVGSGTKLEDRP